MKVLITGNYLKIKFDPTVVSMPLIISRNGKKEADHIIPYSEKAKRYVYLDVRRFKGEELSLKYPKAFRFTQVDSIPLDEIYAQDDRPYVHFTAPSGHINDPNGLLYHNGRYHIFFQYYPFLAEHFNDNITLENGTRYCYWFRQNWGHLVTEDFVNYEYYPIALHHNPTGSAWSGSGVIDEKNVSGLGDGKTPPMLLFYTACGDPTLVHDRKPFEQRMAYSLDGGVNFTVYPKVMVPFIKGANRDPKVIYSDELNKWIMALYLDGDEYAILTSENLLDWTMAESFITHGENECPDFYPITADNGERLWVYSGAHNHYIVGKWEGEKFTPVQQEKILHLGSKYYAGQSFYGADKRININWLRIPYEYGKPYSQAHGFPTERKLIFRNGEYFLTEKPLEIENKLIKSEKFTLKKGGITSAKFEKGPLYVKLNVKCDKETSLTLFGYPISVQPKKSRVVINGQVLPVLDSSDGFNLEFIVDKRSLEVFAGEGESCTAFTDKIEYSAKSLSVKSSGDFVCEGEVGLLKPIKITEFKNI